MPSRSERFRRIAAKVREETNKELAGEIARLTPLTEDEITRLVPTKQDKERLAELMAIVMAATSENARVAAFRRNAGRLGTVAVRLLRAAFG
jgi:hypothetical protein